MIGTIVNTATILAGAIVGSILHKGIGEKYQKALFGACGLAACGIGINAIVNNMPDSNYPVLFIVSLAIGILIGTALDLEGKFERLVNKRSKSENNLGKGLSTGILLYCIGTLSIMGPVMSALYGDHTFLFTNATLDLITSMVLASTYGMGMALAAPVLFAWQGCIYLIAKHASGFISDDLVCELCIVGGFLIFASGLNILNIKNLKTLNLLPALAIPIIFFAIKSAIG
ncbi:DUF554 domain-containing protein [Eubacterium oxidoreducens]|uniref:Transport protein n=1 Tax=Eubacterium oxidoreducens TaxID=1732 RepID=A0A1G6BT29_EUBOX|nr:DUF554 domain-containing protein [Eubacterium oxidoreducens]SDB23707.1 hypothetical protein SAMN02910417_01775 [Eubacterium oxidoreducens]